MSAHIDKAGRFQSDKYPTTPPDCVPLKVTDVTAQDLLWTYAQRRRAVDAEFADDLQSRLREVGYVPPGERVERRITDGMDECPACGRLVEYSALQPYRHDCPGAPASTPPWAWKKGV